MSLGRYVLGTMFLALAFAPLAVFVGRLRHTVVPQLRGTLAALADIVVVLTATVVASELLGTIGLFRVGPFIVAMLLVSGGIGLLAHRWTQPPVVPEAPVYPESRLGRMGDVAVVATVALVFGTWSVRFFDALGNGMLTADTLWYHLPYAARFVQTGYTSHLHYLADGGLTTFFPSSAELLHASGMLLFSNDYLSLFLNLGFLAMALLAAWCIGRPFGVAPLTLLGAAIVLATPEIVLDDPGGGYNDVVAIALLLAAVALLIEATRASARTRSVLTVVAGLGAGLAIGTKFTVLAPVGLLTVCVVFATRRGMLRRGALWLSALFLSGGYFYIRNIVYAHNPVPAVHVGIGPIHLPSSTPVVGQGTVATYLTHGRAWRDYLIPGLRDAMGLAWWAILGLAVAGMIIALTAQRDRRLRALGFVGIVSFAAYVYSPQVISVGSSPYWFVTNVRYVAPALALGLLCLAVVAARRPKISSALLAAYSLILLVTLSDRLIWRSDVNTIIAAPTRGATPRLLGIAVAVGLAAVGVAQLIRRRGAGRLPARFAAPVVSALALIAGFPTAAYYMDHRYRDERAWVLASFRVSDARIATVNLLQSYPLYGDDLSNFVQAVGQRGPRGSFVPAHARDAWLRDLDMGHYSYVVIATSNFAFPTTKLPPELKWTSDDAGARLVRSDNVNGAHLWVFALRQPLDPPVATSIRIRR